MPIQGSVLYRSRRTKTEKLQRKEEFSSQTPAVLGIPPVSATTSREGRLGSKYIEVPQPGTNSPFAVQVQRLHCREEDKHFRACFSTAPSCRQSQSSCWVTFQPSPRGILPSQLLCGGGEAGQTGGSASIAQHGLEYQMLQVGQREQEVSYLSFYEHS